MFIITGYPRSRTAWFSAFMSASGYPCIHEGANGCKSMSEYKEKIKDISDSNTALCMIDNPYPERPLLVIHRNTNAAYKKDLSKLNGLHVNFDEIDTRIGEIFKYLTGKDINYEIYNGFKNLKIETMEPMDIDSAIAMLSTPINKLDISFDISEIKGFLENTEMFGEYSHRTSGNSPHKKAEDIWVRYLNPENCKHDMSLLGKPHESEWLKEIPGVKEVCEKLMDYLQGEKLGGVLVTKIKPGDGVDPHIDLGWHAAYYDKYYIPIKNSAGAKFCFEDVEIDPKEGEVYAFRNDVLHWVKNDSKDDRIAMIVCIKQNKLSKEGVCLGVTQR